MLENYTGMNIAEYLTDKYEKESFLVAYRQLFLNFDNNVEYERLSEQIALCEQTIDFLYATPGPVRYIPGTRYELEKIVNNICCNSKNERDTVLSIMCYIRDLYKKYDRSILFYGGTEEELIKKGGWLCECVSRLMVALCEIKSIPGRTVFHVFSGHFTTELFFEDKWGYIDPRFGLFYLDKEGRFASVEELIRHREIILNQNDFVRSFSVDYCNYDYRSHRNIHFCLSPIELQCYCSYSLMDQNKYHYDWVKYETAQEKIKDGHDRYLELATFIFLK